MTPSLRKLALPALVALALSPNLGCKEKTDRELLVEASSLAATQKHEEAREIFEAVAARSPNDPELLIRYAGLLVQTNEIDRI